MRRRKLHRLKVVWVAQRSWYVRGVVEDTNAAGRACVRLQSGRVVVVPADRVFASIREIPWQVRITRNASVSQWMACKPIPDRRDLRHVFATQAEAAEFAARKNREEGH